MKKQRGQAFILVLILLALGSLMITPVLRFVTTGLYSQRISEQAITNQYAADSAIEEALWMMLNGAMDNLTQSGSSVAFDFTYGTDRYPVTISVPSVPDSLDLATSNAPRHLDLEVSPSFLTGSTANATRTINYVVRIQSQPWSSATSTFEVTLPKGLTYTTNSTWSRGPDAQASLPWDASVNFTAHKVYNNTLAMTNSPGFGTGGNYAEVTTDPPPGGYKANWSYLIKTTLADGRQHLKYSLNSSVSGNRAYIMTYQVTGKPPGGINYALFSAVFGTYTGTDVPTAALGVAFYRILMEVGGITYDVIVAYDSTTDGLTIISYLPVAG